ncbi:amidohydrolase family protein [Pseudonocardia endophytica]|uniref:amidohydrolase family protein n=1 Tax=Pseudonocardia endophytica TaxID=401976 RepID=UPI001FB2EBBF|nr:amidohydrolase family protein [Pseudonocardia endophytica]
MSRRIDVHQHLVPPPYREALAAAGITDVGGRALPDWSPQAALDQMSDAAISSAVLSVSAPGTTLLDDPSAAARLARTLNEYGAELTRDHPGRFGHFATLPLPDVDAAVVEARHALDDLGADGVVLLANSRGRYLGSEGHDRLFAALDERRAVVFVHPAELPGPQVEGIPPFAADFLLDTSRAAYLLVRNQIVSRYPNIRFILSHAGGFVPYAAHRMAVGMAGDTGRTPREILDDFRSFYFDTALSAGPASLLAVLNFARPDHVLYGSDWPFAPSSAVTYFNAGLAEYTANTPFGPTVAAAVDHRNAEQLFPRFTGTAAPARTGAAATTRGAIKDRLARGVFKLMNPS